MNARVLLVAGLASAAALPAAAQNQAVNPHFLTDLGGWEIIVNPAFTATHDPAQGFNTPGAMRVATPAATAVNFVVIRQCLAVTPGAVLDLGGKYRIESGHAANLRGSAGVTWYTDGACTAGATAGPFSALSSDVPDTWQAVHLNDVPVPAGMTSARFLLAIGVTAGEGVGWFDDVYFGPDPLTPVELQGFRVE
jgi:hypothetical protein